MFMSKASLFRRWTLLERNIISGGDTRKRIKPKSRIGSVVLRCVCGVCGRLVKMSQLEYRLPLVLLGFGLRLYLRVLHMMGSLLSKRNFPFISATGKCWQMVHRAGFF